MVMLPDFPVDEGTLGMLMAAIHPRQYGDGDAESSCVGNFLEFMSQMGGSDTKAVEEVIDDGSLPGIGPFAGARIHVMRDPMYHENDVMDALVTEIRRLRAELAELRRTP